MNYLSVCSGIEAASVAWGVMGWTPVAFSEVEAFPSAVLAERHPGVPNLGDMTKFKDWPDATVDLLVGGTPCQSFSVAGLRKGMADPRGNLALVYLAIADRYRPEWLVWENVPGVLSSSGGRDFGAFLGGLGQLGYGFAYRVLDAQYVRVDGFGRAVPQRRRRVFVVGHSGDWRRAAAVLFEPESLSWHSAPRREAGQGVAHDVAPCIGASGRGFERAGETRGQDPIVASVTGALNSASGHAYPGQANQDFDQGFLVPSVSMCLNAGGMGRQDYETETFVAHALRADGFDASEDGTGRGTPLVPITFPWQQGGSMGFSTSEGVCHSLIKNQTHAMSLGWSVRRLTPTECERLQGFPDGYTAITHRGKPAADGPRYKALGNSMAVNAMRWIGRRIELVRSIEARKEAA